MSGGAAAPAGGRAERGERVGGLARLADEERQSAGLKHRLAIAELARDIDVDGYPGELLDPVFRDQPGIIARPAGDDRHPLERAEVEVAGRKRDFAFERPDIALESLGNHDRLLEDLLLHIVAVIALLDRLRSCA